MTIDVSKRSAEVKRELYVLLNELLKVVITSNNYEALVQLETLLVGASTLKAVLEDISKEYKIDLEVEIFRIATLH